jgi:cyclophilin family peptidyl-prolyl cis-trans isomerase
MGSCSILDNPTKIKKYAKINTSEGSFIIGLYEGTPLHKQNFITNCTSQNYDSTLIYSTIPNGVHKMGLKPSKKEEYTLSRTYDDSKIESEINSKLLNKTGAVGMLRLPNDQNPEMQSDNFLFYLVDGIQTDEKLLHTLEAKQNAPIIADYITIFINETGNKHYDDSLKLYKVNNNNKNYRRLYLCF